MNTTGPAAVAFLSRTCIGCPAQWEGMTEDGLFIYVRYRWGYLHLEIGNKEVFGKRIGHEYDGFLEDEEMRAHLAAYLSFP